MSDKKKIAVAMSGGVDSSVAAALLREEGYELLGMTMQLYPQDRAVPNDKNTCAIDDARLVCQALKIPHYVIDVHKHFDRHVVDNFCNEYLCGRTPNPCVVCNEHVKFGAFLTAARECGATHLATGHYVRIEYDSNFKSFLLRQGVDVTKDQSYMLYRLSQEQLSCVLTPLGGLAKDCVREKARVLGLHVAERAESQDICFAGYDRYGQFIEKDIPEKAVPGGIRNTTGKELGRHRGIAHYTIGQRKGLGVAADKPLYVVRIDVEENEIIVGYKDEVLGQKLIAHEVTFIAGKMPGREFRAQAKIRYLHTMADATITMDDETHAHVCFDVPQEAITPGQSVVFYDGDRVLGGGFIEEVCSEAVSQKT